MPQHVLPTPNPSAEEFSPYDSAREAFHERLYRYLRSLGRAGMNEARLRQLMDEMDQPQRQAPIEPIVEDFMR